MKSPFFSRVYNRWKTMEKRKLIVWVLLLCYVGFILYMGVSYAMFHFLEVAAGLILAVLCFVFQEINSVFGGKYAKHRDELFLVIICIFIVIIISFAVYCFSNTARITVSAPEPSIGSNTKPPPVSASRPGVRPNGRLSARPVLDPPPDPPDLPAPIPEPNDSFLNGKIIILNKLGKDEISENNYINIYSDYTDKKVLDEVTYDELTITKDTFVINGMLTAGCFMYEENKNMQNEGSYTPWYKVTYKDKEGWIHGDHIYKPHNAKLIGEFEGSINIKEKNPIKARLHGYYDNINENYKMYEPRESYAIYARVIMDNKENNYLTLDPVYREKDNNYVFYTKIDRSNIKDVLKGTTDFMPLVFLGTLEGDDSCLKIKGDIYYAVYIPDYEDRLKWIKYDYSSHGIPAGSFEFTKVTPE